MTQNYQFRLIIGVFFSKNKPICTNKNTIHAIYIHNSQGYGFFCEIHVPPGQRSSHLSLKPWPLASHILGPGQRCSHFSQEPWPLAPLILGPGQLRFQVCWKPWPSAAQNQLPGQRKKQDGVISWSPSKQIWNRQRIRCRKRQDIYTFRTLFGHLRPYAFAACLNHFAELTVTPTKCPEYSWRLYSYPGH